MSGWRAPSAAVLAGACALLGGCAAGSSNQESSNHELEPVARCGQTIPDHPQIDGLLMKKGPTGSNSNFTLVNSSQRVRDVEPAGLIILVDADNRLISRTTVYAVATMPRSLAAGASTDVIMSVNTRWCADDRWRLDPGTYRPVAILHKVDGMRNVAVPLEPPMLLLKAGGGYRLTE